MGRILTNKHNSSVLEPTATTVRHHLYDPSTMRLILVKRITSPAHHGNQVEEATTHEALCAVAEDVPVVFIIIIAPWSWITTTPRHLRVLFRTIRRMRSQAASHRAATLHGLPKMIAIYSLSTQLYSPKKASNEPKISRRLDSRNWDRRTNGRRENSPTDYNGQATLVTAHLRLEVSTERLLTLRVFHSAWPRTETGLWRLLVRFSTQQIANSMGLCAYSIQVILIRQVPPQRQQWCGEFVSFEARKATFIE